MASPSQRWKRSADRFCYLVELRAELEPARLQPLDLLDDGLEALSGLGELGRVDVRLGEARLERVALGEQDAELVVDAVDLLAQRLGGIAALLARQRRGLALLAVAAGRGRRCVDLRRRGRNGGREGAFSALPVRGPRPPPGPPSPPPSIARAASAGSRRGRRRTARWRPW
jgi:hypothetical protein